jgi:hypothetical protein
VSRPAGEKEKLLYLRSHSRLGVEHTVVDVS